MQGDSPFLYKYLSLNINNLTALNDYSLYFSNYKKLNDSFEFVYSFTKRDDENQERRKFFNQNNNKLVEMSGVLCLTKTDPEDHDKFSSNVLMWSHYASNFKGLCIKFKAKVLDRSFSQNRDCDIFDESVSYSNNPVRINIEKGEGLTSHMFTKHEGWSYENEFRFWSSSLGLKKFDPSCVETFYLGGAMSAPERSLLLLLIKSKYPEAVIKSVEPTLSEYHLKFTEVA